MATGPINCYIVYTAARHNMRYLQRRVHPGSSEYVHGNIFPPNKSPWRLLYASYIRILFVDKRTSSFLVGNWHFFFLFFCSTLFVVRGKICTYLLWQFNQGSLLLACNLLLHVYWDGETKKMKLYSTDWRIKREREMAFRELIKSVSFRFIFPFLFFFPLSPLVKRLYF